MSLQRTNKLGLELIDAGLITEAQLDAALRAQRKSGDRLGEALVHSGAISPGNLIKHLGRRLGVKGCHLRHGLIDPKVARLLAREEAERLNVLPLFLIQGRPNCSRFFAKSVASSRVASAIPSS